MFSLTWRCAKTWRRTSIWGSLTEASFCKECFPTNQKFLRLPVQKLWPIMWFLQKWWPWPWSLSDFNPKKLPGSLELSTWAVEFSCGLYIVKDRTSRVACTSCNYGQTNRQTDRQTNRGDQYTLQKSTILQSNERIIGDLTFYIDFDWHWPLTLTPWPLTLTLTVIYFCKNLMLWRRVTQNGASCIRMEITLR